jgi:uncharacterized membrane protein YcjF (UPF0283 family)
MSNIKLSVDQINQEINDMLDTNYSFYSTVPSSLPQNVAGLNKVEVNGQNQKNDDTFEEYAVEERVTQSQHNKVNHFSSKNILIIILVIFSMSFINTYFSNVWNTLALSNNIGTKTFVNFVINILVLMSLYFIFF